MTDNALHMTIEPNENENENGNNCSNDVYDSVMVDYAPEDDREKMDIDEV